MPSNQQHLTSKPIANHQTPQLQSSPIYSSLISATASSPPHAVKQSAMISAHKNLIRAQLDGPAAEPKQKRQKFDGVPIWAQSFRANQARGGKSTMNNKRQTNSRATPPVRAMPSSSRANGVHAQPIKEESNGHSASTNDVLLPKTQPLSDRPGPLGPWERNILDMEPSDEVTKVVADFLFTEVVARTDIGVAPIGGAAGSGAVIEIEAKIGQLIDKNTNDRLQLPTMTECIVSKDDPSLRVAFKSSMTEVRLPNVLSQVR